MNKTNLPERFYICELRPVQKAKCDLCDKNRKLIAIFPDGGIVTKECKCNEPKYIYKPESYNYLKTYYHSNIDKVSVIYENTKFTTLSLSLMDVEFYNNKISFDEYATDYSKIAFLDYTDCLNFCKYMNDKNNKGE